MSKAKVVFRADGNAQIGLGHLVRSSALAEMLNSDFECTFATRFLNESLETQLKTIYSDILLLPESDAHYDAFLNSLKGHEIVVLDNYFYPPEYQRKIRDLGCALVGIDDLHDTHFHADLVINHAIGIKESEYSGEFYTRYLLGADYALFRKPFSEFSSEARDWTEPKDVLVCFGGSDPNDYTLKVIQELSQVPGIGALNVVVGSAYRNINALKNLKINLFSNLSASEMFHLMQRCDLAVCSASSVAMEYMSIGGGLFLIQTVENQKEVFANLISEGLAFDYKDFSLNLNFNHQLKLQKQKFSGPSRPKYLKVFQSLALSAQLTTRKAIASDLMTYFNWANDPSVRQNAFHPEAIPLPAHTQWFTKNIVDPSRYFYLMELNGIPVAQVRIDTDASDAVINYSVSKDYRGLGLGRIVLAQAIEKFFKESGRKHIVGYVKKDNVPSVNVFLSLHFEKTESTLHEKSWCFKLSSTS